MDTLYIKASHINHDSIDVDLETMLIVNVLKICDSEEIKLNVLLDKEVTEPQFKLYVKPEEFEIIDGFLVPEMATYCVWPVIVVGNTVVAGLCSVSRQVIKSSCNENVRHLLGFREACLVACSESSIWTRFCEIDMVKTVKDVVKDFDHYNGDYVQIPGDLTRFEYHLEQPVRMHNIYKMAREKNNDKDLKSSVPLKDLNIPHSYSEGPFITLADVLLYPCVDILVDVFTEATIRNELPLTSVWYERMRTETTKVYESYRKFKISTGKEIRQFDMLKQSLYSSDPTRYKPQSRIFTKQNNIEASLKLINTSAFKVVNEYEPYGHDVQFSWNDVPLEASPEGGALPKSRSNRKSEQLENLAKATLKVAEDKCYRIVDFCSGSGHLGLLLGLLLPKCRIILVENKEKSLIRAKERITNLNLTNVVLLQCNLDYFRAPFELGVSLHACGVATDLVIQNCILNKAHFVACPCCYGGIHDCYHLRYPRSDTFNKCIGYDDYLHLAHAADQTHDVENVKTKQGYACMDIIDTDRKLYAEKFGYDVHLGKLMPTSCTPKNNLLVGIRR